MPARLGDGVEGKADTLGGGVPSDDIYSIGERSSLFLGLRPARHEVMLLGTAAPAAVPSGVGGALQGPGTGGEGPGDSGGGDGGGGVGDGGGDGGDA